MSNGESHKSTKSPRGSVMCGLTGDGVIVAHETSNSRRHLVTFTRSQSDLPVIFSECVN